MRYFIREFQTIEEMKKMSYHKKLLNYVDYKNTNAKTSKTLFHSANDIAVDAFNISTDIRRITF